MANTSGIASININDHHRTIAAQTPVFFHYTTGIVLLFGTLSSVFTNGSVLLVFFVKDKSHLTKINIYIATICILSLLMAIFGVPLVVISSFNKVWRFGDIGCQYYGFLMTFCGMTTMLILTSIAIDRYIYVVKSNFSIYLSTVYSIAIISVCAAITLAFALCPLFGWNQYTYEGVGTACAIDLIGENNNGRSYVLTLLVVFFLIPVSTIIFSYVSIYTKVIKQTKVHLRSVHQLNTSDNMTKRLRLEHDLAITITCIIGLFLVCWTPYSICLLWKMLNKDVDVDPIAMAIPAMISKLGGIFTPVVYLARNGKFRKQTFSMFHCKTLSTSVHPQTSTTTSYPSAMKTQQSACRLPSAPTELKNTMVLPGEARSIQE